MIEKRAVAGVSASGRKLTGYVATFDRPAVIGSNFTEVIRRGAFAASLASGADILALADHDASRVLGRTRSGTLTLTEDAEGLAFSLQLPDTQAGRDIAELCARGDIGGASFGFTVPEAGDSWNGNQRELRSVTLHEVSIVSAHPAYAGTTVDLRSRQPDGQLAVLRYWLETCR